MQSGRVVVRAGFVVARVAALLGTSGMAASSQEAARAVPGGCHLRGSAHSSPLNEWASCFDVSVTMASLPAIGEEAVLEVSVTAEHDRPGTLIAVQLPSNLAFVGTPQGFAAPAARSPPG